MWCYYCHKFPKLVIDIYGCDLRKDTRFSPWELRVSTQSIILVDRTEKYIGFKLQKLNSRQIYPSFKGTIVYILAFVP